MSNTDPNSFATDSLVRGEGSKSGKDSLTTTEAASFNHLLAFTPWSTEGTAATVTYAFRSTGTPPESDTGVFSAFNAAEIAQTQQALRAWSDVANVTFTRIDSGNGYADNADILFGNYSKGDSAGYTGYSNGGAQVWINGSLSYNAAPTTNNYGGMTILHEIGHALGLSHPSDYDVSDADDPTYSANASYYEDSRQYSVMSYFDVGNTGGYEAGQYPSVPMLDDITAAQTLYGANMSTRTGETVYGFHSNTGEDWFSAANPSSQLVFAAWDAGGNDSFDFSGYSANQTIDLRAGDFSNVGGLTGNVAIAYNSVIENAFGGSSGDVITGNAVANLLAGGSGSDRILGEAGNDVIHGGDGDDLLDGGSGVNVVDGGSGSDTLLLPSQYYPDFKTVYDGDGWYTITGAGIEDKVHGIENVLATGVSAYAVTGPSSSFSYFLSQTSAGNGSLSDFLPFRDFADINDFNQDGKSDILWRNTNGSVSTWSLDGGVAHENTYFSGAPTDWNIAETADFDGDGRSDILWHSNSGAISIWSATAGGFTQNSYYHGSVGTDWRIAAVGDLDGNGTADILWQNNDGAISAWQSTGGGFDENTYYHSSPGGTWKVAGLADFNGDGQADILWRNASGDISTWLGQGTAFHENSFYGTEYDASWKIAGIADFNGDGQADVLFRNANGTIDIADAENGGLYSHFYLDSSVNNDWQIVQVGDFNGDGKADILWRNTNGAISTWDENGHGFDENVLYNDTVGHDWSIAAHDYNA